MGAMTLDLEIWVEGQDEPQTIRADQRDFAAFERFFKVGTSNGMNNMTMIFFRYVGWCALRRTGQTNIGFDDWEKNIVSVEPPDQEDEEVPPTNPAA